MSSMYPTNPSYVRRIVNGMGNFESVRVSPSNGDVSVKENGKWRSFGKTSEILARVAATHKQKYGNDAAALQAN